MSAGTIPTVDDFNAGRDLALAYVREAEAATADNSSDHEVYGVGLLRTYMAKLQAEPRLIDGFDAMVSALLGRLSWGSLNLEWYSKLRHGAVYGPDFDFFEDDDEPKSNVVAFPAAREGQRPA